MPTEGEAAAEEGEEQDAASPDVGGRPAELLLGDDLGGHVGGSAAEDLDALVVGDAGREAEVDDLHTALGVQHYILQFYVSMGDALAVAVL